MEGPFFAKSRADAKDKEILSVRRIPLVVFGTILIVKMRLKTQKIIGNSRKSGV